MIGLFVLAAVVGAGPLFSTPSASAAPAGPAYPLKASANGRYLVDQANQPVFWSGDGGWSLIIQGTNADIDYYLSNRQQKGFDVVLMNLIDHKFGSNAPRNFNGDPPFTGTAFSTAPNDAYFAHADYAVTSAAQKGLAVLLDPLYIGYGCGDEGWCAEIQAASTQDMQAWGQYVGTRYKNFDNIVWLVGGDVDPTAYPGLSAKVTAFVTGLQQADGRHLITAHNVRGQMAISPWPGASWLTLNDIYSTYAATYQMGQTAYNVSPAKPFFEVEGYYENEHSMTTQQLRAQAYWTVLSGGMGYMFGNCPTWGLGAPAAAFCPSANADWKVQLESPGSTGMTYAHALFASRAWQNLVPDWNHTALIGGFGTFGNTDYATAGLSADGTLLLAYLPTSRTVTVDATRLSSTFAARWYDPSSGGYAAIAGSPFANTGSLQFTPGGNNSAGDGDWVLVLEASTSSPTATPTATPTAALTGTATVASTLTPTATATLVPAATATFTPNPTVVSTFTPIATATLVPAATATLTPNPTVVSTFTPTPTATVAASTPTVAATPTHKPTTTATPVRTATPTRTSTPTAAAPTAAASTPTAAPAAGLVARYGLNEGAGTAVGDTSGNNLNGTSMGATWTTSGKYGAALSFNGSSSYVDLGRPAALMSTGSMTWEAWVYATAHPANDGQIVALSNGSTGWELKTTPDAGPRNFGVLVQGANGTWGERMSRTVVALNTWTHVAGVYNASSQTLDIYVNGVQDDGVLQGAVPAAQALPAGVNVNIGHRSGGSGYTFAGTLDELKIYSRPLTQSEIQADMNTR